MTHELKLVDDMIQSILQPLGFKKRKLLWWRECGEITQVIGLDKMTYGFPHYNFCYGLVIDKFKFPHIPRIAINGLNVDWNFAEKVLVAENKSFFLEALKLDSPMPIEQRLEAIRALVTDYVLPTFEATNTIEKLRVVLNTLKHPYRTSMTTFLLEDL